jgi:hypothetical protein
MEKYTRLFEDGVIILIMSVFTVLNQMLGEEGQIPWGRIFAKLFTNFVAGWGFYYALIAYDGLMADFPQKVPAIMISTYVGSRLIDTIVDGLYKLNWKEILRRWLGL